MKKYINLICLFILCSMFFELIGCGNKERNIKIFWTQGLPVAKNISSGIDVDNNPVYFSDAAKYLETIVTDANGNIIKTGWIDYSTDNPDCLEIYADSDRVAHCQILNHSAKYVKMIATYHDEGIEPIVKEVQFMVARDVDDFMLYQGYDFDNHILVDEDDPNADMVFKKHVFLDFWIGFPYGYKMVPHPNPSGNIEVHFATYNTIPLDEELIYDDFFKVFGSLEYHFNEILVIKTSEGKCIKIFIPYANSGGSYGFSYAEIDPPIES